MPVKRLFAALLAAALLLALPGCGKKDAPAGSSSSSGGSASSSAASSQQEPEPDPEPALPYRHPLTGVGMTEDISGDRPVAVMLNNLKKALPQLGVAQADLIYEMPAEGGITRMMAVPEPGRRGEHRLCALRPGLLRLSGLRHGCHLRPRRGQSPGL